MGQETGTTVFRRLKGTLRTATDRDFERAVLPWLRLLWPNLVPAPALGSYDKIGIDLIAWQSDGHPDVVIQCKGFKATERQLGHDQVRQCLDSIRKFEASGQTATTYVLIYNRYGKQDLFRSSIDAALKGLVDAGQVRYAELWACDTLLRESAKSLKKRLLEAIRHHGSETARRSTTPTGELCRVPLRRTEVVVDRYQLKEVSDSSEGIADPAEEMLAVGVGLDARMILLGEAGFGKTIAAIRATSNSMRRVFLVRAAGFVEGPVNKSALLSHFRFIENDLLVDLSPEDQIAVLPLARNTIDTLFCNRETQAVLLIDGLDESTALSRRGGLQWLFNSFARYEIPVILTARTEFWRARAHDFATSFGLISRHKGPSQRDTRITDAAQQKNLDDFSELVKKGSYKEFYGDIPRRPLFLKFILETVALSGIRRVNRTELVEEWCRAKIVRDYIEPLTNDGAGRLSILNRGEPVESTISIAFQAMKRAAQLMCRATEDAMEMLPTCKVQDVLDRERIFLDVIDPLGLFLNSLLVPVDNLGIAGSMRFAHKLYQEFFLAKYVRDNPKEYSTIKLPEAVQNWLKAFECEH